MSSRILGSSLNKIHLDEPELMMESSIEDYRMMTFVVKKEPAAAVDSASDTIWAVWSLVGHQWFLVTLQLTFDHVLGQLRCRDC
jgi:hypothetical protein